ncbi:MAG: BatD family protein [Gemmatimonadota bacterium]|uniref:BatD family protein n=1 Tax=Candidatus Palauibacter scopulicola TaxID=3056741 RepID=UPI00239D661A|nr:BatD family protein [Candidatus Palauibacter scopulicola]MDE2663692.1 BatD family protein [Candidatus Palauibacter scopulicola]
MRRGGLPARHGRPATGVALGSLMACLLGPGSLSGQGVTASAHLDRGEVGVGQTFTLNVVLEGVQRFDQDPALPDMGGFAAFLSSGTQSSVRIVNGQTTVSLTVQYRFQATMEGTFEIGPVTVEAGGETLATEPLSLRVSSAPPPTPGAGGAPAGQPSDPGTIGPDDLFIVAEPDKRRVRENEPVIVEYRLFTRVNVSSYGVTRLPGTAGFWVEEFELPQQPEVEQIVRDEVAYATAVIRKVALYPTGPGTKTLEPLAIEAQVRVQRRSRDPFDDVFGGFFNRSSLFGDVLAAGAASRPVEIEVLPLPAEGRPADFTGLVGDLAVASSVDRDSLAANEAATLRVEVSGSGNLKALAPPELAFPPTVEAFPPEVSDRLRTADSGVSGTRTWEYVLIPRAPGVLTIPGVDMGYYDAAEDRYEIASAAPVELRVTGRAVEDALPGARARGSVEALRSDIRFIRMDTPRFRRRGETLFDRAWFWVVALAPVGMVAGAAGLRRRRDRLAGDQAYARDRRAARVAKKRLARAAGLAGGDDARAFYAETAQALEGFVADKLDTSAAGMIRDDLRAALLRRGAREPAVEEYFAVLEACDRQRFAPVGAEIEERKAFLARAESVLSALAGELR